MQSNIDKSSSHNRSNKLEAWKKSINENSSNPLLRKELSTKNNNLFYKFSEHYEKLTALPRKVRRGMQKKWKHSLAGIALVLALGASPAMGADFNVNSSDVDGLRQAITDANNNMEADNIILDGSTFTLPDAPMAYDFNGYNGLPVITTEITIEGNGSEITRDGMADSFRIIAINGDTESGDLTINNTTISGGLAEGADPVGKGGGIYNYGGSLTLNNSVITNNESYRSAGDNITIGGGGIAVGSADTAVTEINDSQILNNTAIATKNVDGFGGGIGGGLLSVGQVTIENSLISGNGANAQGGGIRHSGDYIITINNSTITGNYVTNGNGGGFAASVVNTAYINNSVITNNTADNDEAIIEDSDDGKGGGIYRFNGVMDVAGTEISGNTAIDGGGIYSYGFAFDGVLNLDSSTISGNNASYSGAGINNNFANTNIINSTISGNMSDYRGGGIYNYTSSTSTIVSSTITLNNAYDTGGGIRNSNGGAAYLTNSIVSGNTSDEGTYEIDSYGGNTYGDNYNVFGHSTLTNNIAFDDFTPGGSDINANMMPDGSEIPLNDILDTTLADNGGPTLTHALPSNSPAIDFIPDGNCLDLDEITLMEDQRGFTRPVDVEEPNDPALCDAGAFELQSTSTVTITKETDPAGRMGFAFTSTGFDDFDGCAFQNDFTLDDGDTVSCVIPTMSAGEFTITELPPIISAENIVSIECREQTDDLQIDEQNGSITFTIDEPGDIVDCTFLNIVPTPLFNIIDEPAGDNCLNGGVKIEQGSDLNNNGVLDTDEVVEEDTTFVCDGEQGAEGEDGGNAVSEVTPEPAGANCANGGNKVDVGVDLNGDGELGMDEIQDTFYVCNGEPGEQGPEGPSGDDGEAVSGGNNDDGDGCGTLVGSPKPITAFGNIFVSIIPAMVGFACLFWRRRR